MRLLKFKIHIITLSPFTAFNKISTPNSFLIEKLHNASSSSFSFLSKSVSIEATLCTESNSDFNLSFDVNICFLSKLFPSGLTVKTFAIDVIKLKNVRVITNCKAESEFI